MLAASMALGVGFPGLSSFSFYHQVNCTQSRLQLQAAGGGCLNQQEHPPTHTQRVLLHAVAGRVWSQLSAPSLLPTFILVLSILRP